MMRQRLNVETKAASIFISCHATSGVAGAEGFVGEFGERVRAADIPIDVAAGCLALNDAIVGILRVRREQAKPGHDCPMLRLGAGSGGARCRGRAGPSQLSEKEATMLSKAP